METLGLALVWLLLLAAKGFFSGSEIAIVNADKIKLQAHADQGHAGSRLALAMFRRPERLLATTLVGTNIFTVSLAVVTTTLMLQFFGHGGDYYALLIGTPLLLIFGEIVPKSVYQQSADRITPSIAYPLKIFSWLFYPLILIFSGVGRLLAKVVLRNEAPRTLFVVREQLQTLIDMSERAADVTVFDRVRIKNVIRFADITVGQVMTPIADVVGMQRNASMRDAIAIARNYGFRDFPVYEGNISNITGMISLSAWDLIDSGLHARPLSEKICSPHFVTAGEPVDDLLSLLRGRNDHTAIVIDEYGSAIGLVTIKDVTRLVVGQIGRKSELRASAGESPGQDTATAGDTRLVDARLRISELNEMLGSDLTAENFHTIGGLMSVRLRRVPHPGDTIEEIGFRFTVEEGTDRGPTRIRIESMETDR